MPQMKRTVYQRLNKKEQAHIRECFEGPASRITITRVKATVQHQRERGLRCWDCESILRKLGGML